jgi:GxxExxY protein
VTGPDATPQAPTPALPDFARALEPLTERIIGCALEVHRELGPGLLESAYESALLIELAEAGLACRSQVAVPMIYKGRLIGEYRIDLIVENMVVVEVKSVERLDPVFDAQLLTYLRLSGKRVGLLLNFNSRLLKHGIKRVVL